MSTLGISILLSTRGPLIVFVNKKAKEKVRQGWTRNSLPEPDQRKSGMSPKTRTLEINGPMMMGC